MIRAAVVVFLLGWAPILAYALLGPADGNPVGLGLLAWAATALSVVLGALGLLVWCVRLIRG